MICEAGILFISLHLVLSINNLENGSIRKRENVHYKKTADLVLACLFIRTNGKGDNFHDCKIHKGADWTAWMGRLVCAFVVSKFHKNFFCMEARLILHVEF